MGKVNNDWEMNLNVEGNEISFVIENSPNQTNKEPVPQFKRNKKFDFKVLNWDATSPVDKVTLQNFRPLRLGGFDGDEIWQELADQDLDWMKWVIVAEKATSGPEPGNVTITYDGKHKNEVKLDTPFESPLEHRMVEYDMEVEGSGGVIVTIDPAWDEKP